jgi:hypothetical protein
VPQEVWASDLAAASSGPVTWLWHGFLAPGYITLLTSQWKSVKTTLLAVLLSRLNAGGSLAGQALLQGKAAVASEESYSMWDERHRRLDFADRVCFICRPFSDKPSRPEWLALVDRLAGLCTGKGVNLVVIDSLTYFYPGRSENQAPLMMETLMPLQRLTALGAAVLVLHHPTKREAHPGLAARGSGALPAHVDVLMEMRWYARGAEADRRRRLNGYSRFEQTPRELLIELDHAGSDYRVLTETPTDDFPDNWKLLRLVLEDADYKLTRRQVMDEWPPDFEKPAKATLWRWLEQAVARDLVRHEGSGRKSHPFRYWLAENEPRWQNDPFYQVELLREQSSRLLRGRPTCESDAK